MNDGMGVIARAINTRMHTNNFARCRIHYPFYHLTIIGHYCQQFAVA